jgi:hypothetical protein
MLKDFIIKYDFQRLTSNDTTSHKTRRKVISLEGKYNRPLAIQRSWLSYWYPSKYVLDNIGGTGSFVYMIGSGVNGNSWVSDIFLSLCWLF